MALFSHTENSFPKTLKQQFNGHKLEVGSCWNFTVNVRNYVCRISVPAGNGANPSNITPGSTCIKAVVLSAFLP